MKRLTPIALALSFTLSLQRRRAELGDRRALDAIDTVVVIYAENRGFDNLYGLFPGANGIPGVNPTRGRRATCRRRTATARVLPALPPAWGGLTAAGQPVTVTQAQTAGLPNTPFQIDDPTASAARGVVVPHRRHHARPVHRFYNNQMQIDGGTNDKFAA